MYLRTHRRGLLGLGADLPVPTCTCPPGLLLSGGQCFCAAGTVWDGAACSVPLPAPPPPSLEPTTTTTPAPLTSEVCQPTYMTNQMCGDGSSPVWDIGSCIWKCPTTAPAVVAPLTSPACPTGCTPSLSGLGGDPPGCVCAHSLTDRLSQIPWWGWAIGAGAFAMFASGRGR